MSGGNNSGGGGSYNYNFDNSHRKKRGNPQGGNQSSYGQRPYHDRTSPQKSHPRAENNNKQNQNQSQSQNQNQNLNEFSAVNQSIKEYSDFLKTRWDGATAEATKLNISDKSVPFSGKGLSLEGRDFVSELNRQKFELQQRENK